MADILHHNDGKQKSQSHEVYSKELDNHFNVFLYGYGETKAEAYQDFLSKLDAYILKLNAFRASVHIDETVNVDCFGYPVKEER